MPYAMCMHALQEKYLQEIFKPITLHFTQTNNQSRPPIPILGRYIMIIILLKSLRVANIHSSFFDGACGSIGQLDIS